MNAQKVSFFNEISKMMFGFGDSHKPNPETVYLVENIVLGQLRTVVQEALKYSDGKNLKEEHVVFLMRHNKYKMRRFVKYLQNKGLAEQKLNPSIEASAIKHHLLDFIASIDETGELMDVNEFDEVKYERQLRANRISLALDEKKYIEFAKARSTSFSRRVMTQTQNFEQLRIWLDPKNEINFSTVALDVLSYLAYETVAQLTDYALLIRLDSKCTSDPVSKLSGMFYTAAMFNEDKFSGDKPDYSKVYSGQAPISVNEIKEVMRRIYSPQAGRLQFGRKLPETHYILAL